jgi:outer membrane protein
MARVGAGKEGLMRSFWAVCAITAAMVVAPVARAETLADALIAAYKTSNLLDQNQAVLRAADEDAAIAVARLRPVVDFVLQGGWRKLDNPSTPTANSDTFAGSMTLSASVLIYAGGRGKMGIEVAREAVLSTRAALVNVEQEVLLAAVSAYVDVRLQAEIVSLRESNTRLITQELRAAKDRFDVGEVTLTDVSLAEARLAAARSGLAAAQGNLMIARERYKATTGAYPGNLAGLPKLPKTAKSQEEARAVAVRGHPFVIQAQHEAKAAELRVAIAKAGLGPTVRGQASISEDFDGVNTTSLGLSVNQTLYAGGELSALYRKSLAGKEIAQASLHQTSVVVAENVGRAWVNLAMAGASINAGSQQVSAAQKAFDGVREEATLGARTTLDVLNAEQELLNARATKLEAEANRYVGTYQLLSSMGKLTAEHLNLGIAVFDPEAYYDAVKNAPATSVQGKALDKILGKIAN